MRRGFGLCRNFYNERIILETYRAKAILFLNGLLDVFNIHVASLSCAAHVKDSRFTMFNNHANGNAPLADGGGVFAARGRIIPVHEFIMPEADSDCNTFPSTIVSLFPCCLQHSEARTSRARPGPAFPPVFMQMTRIRAASRPARTAPRARGTHPPLGAALRAGMSHPTIFQPPKPVMTLSHP